MDVESARQAIIESERLEALLETPGGEVLRQLMLVLMDELYLGMIDADTEIAAARVRGALGIVTALYTRIFGVIEHGQRVAQETVRKRQEREKQAAEETEIGPRILTKESRREIKAW